MPSELRPGSDYEQVFVLVNRLHLGCAVFAHDTYWPKVLAAALSLAFTGALMVLLRLNHPPAGATTLSVSLGILPVPPDLVIIEVAVVLLTVQAFLIKKTGGAAIPRLALQPPSTFGWRRGRLMNEMDQSRRWLT